MCKPHDLVHVCAGGSLDLGGLCTNGACYWFTNNIEIDVPESLPFEARSMKVMRVPRRRSACPAHTWPL